MTEDDLAAVSGEGLETEETPAASATQKPDLLVFQEWLARNTGDGTSEEERRIAADPMEKYRGYSRYIRQALLERGEWNGKLVGNVDQRLAQLAVDSQDYTLEEGEEPPPVAQVLAAPPSDTLPLDALYRWALERTPDGRTDPRMRTVSMLKALKEGGEGIAVDADDYATRLSGAESAVREWATPEVLAEALREEVVRDGKPAVLLPPTTPDAQPDVFVNRDLLALVDPETGEVDDVGLAKVLKAHQVDPMLIPGIRAKLSRVPGLTASLVELERHEDFVVTLDSLARTGSGTDPGGPFAMYETLDALRGMIKSRFERGDTTPAFQATLEGRPSSEWTPEDYAFFQIRQQLRGTPLEDYPLEEQVRFVEDYAKMGFTTDVDRDDPAKSLQRLSNGAVVVPDTLLYDKELFERAVNDPSVPVEQRDRLRAQRDAVAEVNAGEAIRVISEHPEFGMEFLRFMEDGRERGKTDVRIVEEWVATGKFSPAKELARGVGSSVKEAVGMILLAIPAMRGNTGALETLKNWQKEDASRRAYANLFAYEHGMGYDLSRLVAPVAADIGVGFLTRGALSPVVSAARTTGGNMVKSAMRASLNNYLSTGTRTAATSWIKAGARRTALAEGAAKGAALRYSVDDVISMAGRDIANRVATGTAYAGAYAAGFNRSAGSTYASLSTALADQKHPDGSPRYTPGEVREIAFTHATAAGLITVASMSAFASLGMPGMEMVLRKGLTNSQMTRVMQRLSKDVKGLPAVPSEAGAAAAAQATLREMMKGAMTPLFRGAAVRGVMEEAPQEAIDQFLNSFNEARALNEDFSIADAARGAVYAGMLGGVMGGTVAGVGTAIQSRRTPSPRLEATIRSQRLLDAATKLDATSPRTANVLRRYAVTQPLTLPAIAEAESRLRRLQAEKPRGERTREVIQQELAEAREAVALLRQESFPQVAEEGAPEATPETPEATPETPEATPETPEAETPEATPEVAPEATPETPEATPETPEATPETPEATPETPPTRETVEEEFTELVPPTPRVGGGPPPSGRPFQSTPLAGRLRGETPPVAREEAPAPPTPTPKKVLTETVSSGKRKSTRQVTEDGVARVEAAKQRLREIVNNEDIVGRQRTDMIADGRNLIQFLDSHADTRKPLQVVYHNGFPVALTNEAAPDGFASAIVLEGPRAGRAIVISDTLAADARPYDEVMSIPAPEQEAPAPPTLAQPELPGTAQPRRRSLSSMRDATVDRIARLEADGVDTTRHTRLLGRIEQVMMAEAQAARARAISPTGRVRESADPADIVAIAEAEDVPVAEVAAVEPEQPPAARDATKPEQMTPADVRRVYTDAKELAPNLAEMPRTAKQIQKGIELAESSGVKDPELRGLLISSATSPTAQFAGFNIVNQHKVLIEDALESNRPVSAEAVDTYGIALPEGYVKQGELYIYQPPQPDATGTRTQQQDGQQERVETGEGGLPEEAGGRDLPEGGGTPEAEGLPPEATASAAEILEGYTSGMSRMEQGRVRKVLEKPARVENRTLPIFEHIVRMVRAGGRFNTREVVRTVTPKVRADLQKESDRLFREISGKVKNDTNPDYVEYMRVRKAIADGIYNETVEEFVLPDTLQGKIIRLGVTETKFAKHVIQNETELQAGARVSPEAVASGKVDTSHLDAILGRISRERQRLAEATTDKERSFRQRQVAQAEKELASEYEFLGITPPGSDSDLELLAQLGVESLAKTAIVSDILTEIPEGYPLDRDQATLVAAAVVSPGGLVNGMFANPQVTAAVRTYLEARGVDTTGVNEANLAAIALDTLRADVTIMGLAGNTPAPSSTLAATDAEQASIRAELDRYDIGQGTEALLRKVASEGPKGLRSIARLLLETGAANVEIRVIDMPDFEAAGFYVPGTSTVHINVARPGPRGVIDSVIHELVHAATDAAIRNPNPEQAKVVKRLDKVRQSIRKRMDLDPATDYATGTTDEFVTHFLTDPAFRDSVSRMTPKAEKNWVKVIAELLADLLHYGRVRTKAERATDQIRNDMLALFQSPEGGAGTTGMLMQLPKQARMVAIFNETTADLYQGRESVTQEEIDAWRDANPEKWEMLSRMREDGSAPISPGPKVTPDRWADAGSPDIRFQLPAEPDFAAAEQKFNQQVDEYITNNWPADAEGRYDELMSFAGQWAATYAGIPVRVEISPEAQSRFTFDTGVDGSVIIGGKSAWELAGNPDLTEAQAKRLIASEINYLAAVARGDTQTPDIRFQLPALTEADFRPDTVRETAQGFLPEDVEIDSLGIDFAQVAEEIDDLSPVNAENYVRAAVNHALTLNAGRAALAEQAPVRGDYDSDEAFATATRDFEEELDALVDTYERVTRGTITDAALARYKADPSALRRLVTYLTEAIKSAYNRLALRYDPATAVAINRMARELAYAREGYRSLRESRGYDSDVRFQLPAGGARITPEQDAEYLAAVARGDMETAQRMVDREADLSPYKATYSHGTRGQWYVWDQGRGGGLINLGPPDVAESYAHGAGGRRSSASDPHFVTEQGDHLIPVLSDTPGRLDYVSRNIGEKFSSDYVQNLYEQGYVTTWYPDARNLKLRVKLDSPLDLRSEDGVRVLAGIRADSDGGRAIVENAKSGSFAWDSTKREGHLRVWLNDLAPKLKSLGYDGLIYRDYGHDTVAVFDGNQIKSADPVTYDDQGNVIPLSQRFDTQTPDIRFQLPAPARPDTITQVLNSRSPQAGFMSFYDNDPMLLASSEKPLSNNRFVRWAQERFVNTLGSMARVSEKAKANADALARTAEATLQSLAGRLRKAVIEETPDHTLVATAAGNNAPLLTEDEEVRINREFDENVEVAKARINELYAPQLEAAAGSPEVLNALRDTIKGEVRDAVAREDSRRKAAAAASRQREAERRRADQHAAMAELQRSSPDTYEAVLNLRAYINDFQRLASDVNSDSPELQFIIDQSNSIFLVRSYGVHMDPKMIDMMLDPKGDPDYTRRREAAINYFMPLAREQLIAEYESNADYMAELHDLQQGDPDRIRAVIDRDVEIHAPMRAVAMFEDFMVGHQSSRDLFSGGGVGNEISRYMAKTNVPQELRDALVENTDPLFNLVNTATSLSRLVINARLLGQIATQNLDLGNYVTTAEKISGVTFAQGRDVLRSVLAGPGNDNLKADLKAKVRVIYTAAVERALAAGRAGTPEVSEVDALIENAFDEFGKGGASFAELLPELGTNADRSVNDIFIRSNAMSPEVRNRLQPTPGKYANWKELVGGKEGDTLYKPLHGLWASPEQHEAFHAAFRTGRMQAMTGAKKSLDSLNRVVLGVAGASLGVVTLGNPGYYVRNVIGGGFMALAQGVDFTDPETWRYANEFFRGVMLPNGEISPEFQELVAGRIALDGAQIGYLKEIFEEVSRDPAVGMRRIMEMAGQADTRATAIGKAGQYGKAQWRKLTTTLGRLAELSEVLPAVLTYVHFKRQLESVGFGTEQEIQQEASRLTKMVMPSKSEASAMVTAFTRSGFGAIIAPFVRFKAEVVRNAINTFRIANEWSRSDNPQLRALGRRKFAYATAVYGLTAALPLIFNRILSGMSDEEDRAIRTALPTYLRNASLYFLKTEDGVRVFNLTYTIPMSFVTDPFSRIADAVISGRWSEIPAVAGRFIAEDFLGENIVASNVMDVKRNKSSTTGFQIYMDTDTETDKVFKAASHILGGSFKPRAVTQVERFVEASQRDTSRADFWFTPTGVAAATVVPFRAIVLKNDDIERRAFNEIRKQNSDFWQITSKIFSPMPISADEAIAAYDKRMDAMARQNARTLDLVKGMVELRGGGSAAMREVERSMVAAGISKRKAGMLLRQKAYERLVFPQEQLQRIRKYNPSVERPLLDHIRRYPSRIPIPGESD